MPHIGRRGRSGGSTSRRKDVAPVIARRQRQITTAGLVPAGLSGLWYHPVIQVQPPGRSHA
jgi:hypothetical protein